MSDSQRFAERVQKMPLGGVVVLFVDDNADTCDLVTTILTQTGAKVITTSSVRGAIEVITQAKPDILIADIGLPDHDGYELIQKLRTLTPGRGTELLPAIALTGYADPRDRLRSLTSGYQVHISKPFHPDDLVTAVENLTRPSLRKSGTA